jgi:acetylornithine deacetylase/succinyl-diaminopimelate desuccinylase-like protein
MLRIVIAAIALATSAVAPAQNLNAVRQSADGKAVLAALAADQAETNALLVRIGSIISPSGAEGERAAAVADAMRAAGLQDVTITDAPNVIGRIPGRSGKALVFVSTLDDLATVAEHQRASGKPLAIEGTRIVGPGANTSSTTAAMVAAAKALVARGVKPEHDLVFAAVAQEETGLNGMRALYSDWKDRAVAFVDILGDGGSISYGALGIHWWKIVASGPAGHTLRGGLPNVNQAIGRAVDRILSLPDARNADRMTRINVAVLSSGAVFNHKPATGWFSLDVRSLDADRIAGIERDAFAILDQVEKETSITLTPEVVNKTPGGQIAGARDSALVRWASAIAKGEGKAAELSDAGSANLNIAIAGGTPAIGLGGERGGDRGQPGEWADIDVLHRTARVVALLALTVGQDRPAAR